LAISESSGLGFQPRIEAAASDSRCGRRDTEVTAAAPRRAHRHGVCPISETTPGAGMAALDDPELQRLRARLEAREAQLREEVRRVEAESADTPGSAAHGHVEDIGERGEERIRGAMRHAEKERDIEELRAIGAAKERMVQGSYGLCVDCAAAIPLNRLEVQPAAMRCVPCQERFERSHLLGARIPPVI
jgi:RNA polymerase-binding transcription factor DksA